MTKLRHFEDPQAFQTLIVQSCRCMVEPPHTGIAASHMNKDLHRSVLSLLIRGGVLASHGALASHGGCFRTIRTPHKHLQTTRGAPPGFLGDPWWIPGCAPGVLGNCWWIPGGPLGTPLGPPRDPPGTPRGIPGDPPGPPGDLEISNFCYF